MATGLFTLKQVNQAIQQGGWPNRKPNAVDYLVVAGGGGGGGGSFYGSGGGGAGGLLQGNIPVATGTSITVTVGAGGTGAAGNASTNPGSNSVFGSITATGGGNTSNNGAGNGGSGGSGSGGGSAVDPTSSGGQGTFGQGNAGGSGLYASNGYGGGGGAGTVGLNGLSNAGGNGGAGVASVISGTVTTYAGGGGGGVTAGVDGGTLGQGGAGGGGTGGRQSGSSSNANGTAGTANTGGGGGSSGGFNTNSGGSGGSGIVIISYPDTYAAAASTTGSPTVSTSGSGSIALSGTLQSLSTPTSSGLTLGTGDFTIEAWVYANSVAGEKGFFQISDVASGFSTSYTSGVVFYLNTPTTSISCNVGGTAVSSGATAITTSTWYHIAVTRASGSVRLFINGALVGGPTTITANLTGSYAAVGGYYNNSYLWNGNISNLRVVKGTAVYTAAFTPSTTPLTPISGTSLLMNTVSGAQLADGSSSSLTLAPISGSTAPTWNALSPFTVTGYKNRVYTWTSSGSITF